MLFRKGAALGPWGLRPLWKPPRVSDVWCGRLGIQSKQGKKGDIKRERLCLGNYLSILSRPKESFAIKNKKIAQQVGATTEEIIEDAALAHGGFAPFGNPQWWVMFGLWTLGIKAS